MIKPFGKENSFTIQIKTLHKFDDQSNFNVSKEHENLSQDATCSWFEAKRGKSLHFHFTKMSNPLRLQIKDFNSLLVPFGHKLII